MKRRGLWALIVCGLAMSGLTHCTDADRPWDWVELGDPSARTLQPGDWVWYRWCDPIHPCANRIRQVTRTSSLALPELPEVDSLPVAGLRAGDAVVLRGPGQRRLEVVLAFSESKEAVGAIVMREGWRELAEAVGFEVDEEVAGCWLDWADEPQHQALPWGTEVELTLVSAPLPFGALDDSMARKDVWAFPLGVADQLVPPLDSLLLAGQGNFRAWCLAEIGHEPLKGGTDANQAFSVQVKAVHAQPGQRH